jgi:hypothetical protein
MLHTQARLRLHTGKHVDAAAGIGLLDGHFHHASFLPKGTINGDFLRPGRIRQRIAPG